MCERDSQAVVRIIEQVIKDAEAKFDHQSLSSFKVTSFIRDEFEKRYEFWAYKIEA